MATYYMGSGGNDANDGLSWADRKATLGGIDDIPAKVGDKVYTDPIEISPSFLFEFLLSLDFDKAPSA